MDQSERRLGSVSDEDLIGGGTTARFAAVQCRPGQRSRWYPDRSGEERSIRRRRPDPDQRSGRPPSGETCRGCQSAARPCGHAAPLARSCGTGRGRLPARHVARGGVLVLGRRVDGVPRAAPLGQGLPGHHRNAARRARRGHHHRDARRQPVCHYYGAGQGRPGRRVRPAGLGDRRPLGPAVVAGAGLRTPADGHDPGQRPVRGRRRWHGVGELLAPADHRRGALPAPRGRARRPQRGRPIPLVAQPCLRPRRGAHRTGRAIRSNQDPAPSARTGTAPSRRSKFASGAGRASPPAAPPTSRAPAKPSQSTRPSRSSSFPRTGTAAPITPSPPH